MKNFKFAGVKFSEVNLAEAVRGLGGAAKNQRKSQVCVTNVFSAVLMQEDEEFREINNSAALAVADGMPIVWISKLFGNPLPQRIAGSDLFFGMCRAALQQGFNFYFLGSSNQVLEKIEINLKSEFPGLNIAGMYSPPYRTNFSESENAEILRKINDVKPDVLWVGMTAPKQEKWIAHNFDKLNVKIAIGVGAVFDFVAGTVQRSPVWMQKMGLEWLFRLIQEPRRMWKRYLVGNTVFIWLVLKELVKRYDICRI